MKKLIKHKIFSFVLLTFFNYSYSSISKEKCQQDLIKAIHNHNIDDVKLALTMGANANLKDDKTNNSILLDALIELKNLHLIKYRIPIYKTATGILGLSTILTIIITSEIDQKLNNKLYDTLFKGLICSIPTLVTLFFGFKAIQSHRNYKNSLKIVKEILSTPGTIINEIEIQEFLNTKNIPEEISSMIEAMLAAQSTAKLLIKP